jgi:Uma2 family endonuclease
MLLCELTDDDPCIEERPTLVVEVLSPSTTPTDRREKLTAYRRLESALCYLVIHQGKRLVEHHWPESADGRWEFAMVEEGEIAIPGLGVELSLDQTCEGVEIDASR